MPDKYAGDLELGDRILTSERTFTVLDLTFMSNGTIVLRLKPTGLPKLTMWAQPGSSFMVEP